MKATDGALLALIVDDEAALHVAAAWAALELPLTATTDEEWVRTIAVMANIHPDVARVRLHKLTVARAIVDGGISELADKMLQAHVQIRLQGKKKT